MVSFGLFLFSNLNGINDEFIYSTGRKSPVFFRVTGFMFRPVEG